MSLPLRRLSVFAVLVVALAAVPGAPSAAETDVPVLAGDTTIEAAGVTAITVTVPQATGLIPGSARLKLRDGTFGFMFIRLQGDAVAGVCEFCNLDAYATVPELTRVPDIFTVGGCSNDARERIPCELQPGPLEIYFVSDGVLTFSAEFVDLPGRTELLATGRVNGILETLTPTSCPTNDCERLSVSHKVHSIGLDGPGMVMSFAYAELPDGELAPDVYRDQAGRQGIAGCTYPSFYEPEGSPDPADHPLGCDFVPPPVGSGDANRNLNTFAVQGAAMNYNFQGVFSGYRSAHGPAYAGYTQQNHTLGDQQGQHGGWAFWLDAGIS